jgi:uncharacterized membrane protein
MSQAPGSSRVPVTFGQAFRRYFVTGLATLFPVAVTIWLVVQIFQFADGFLGNALGFQFPGLGLAVTLLVILLVGVLSVHFFGRVLFQVMEFWLKRLPIVRSIYPPVKQLADFLFGGDDKAAQTFKRVVIIPYPRQGVYSIAFVTNETKTVATGKPQTFLTCLIPNPPSPFTGPLMFVPEEDAIPLDLSVEDAVKFVVSGGVVATPLNATPRT